MHPIKKYPVVLKTLSKNWIFSKYLLSFLSETYSLKKLQIDGAYFYANYKESETWALYELPSHADFQTL